MGNFIFVGKKLMSRLQMMSDNRLAVITEMDSAAASVAASDQSLADNTSTQAAAIEEAASSLEEMSTKTKGNADNAEQAKTLVSEEKAIVDKDDIALQIVRELNIFIQGTAGHADAASGHQASSASSYLGQT
ncbi:MAG: hypothetical protein R6X08_01125 [Desulfosalsimonadaceae bacterium]